MGAAVHQGPGQSRASSRNWEHVDLVPTVADMLGIKVPWEMDGVSQAGAEPRTRTEKWFFSRPGERQVFPGPENMAKALHGVTDEMVEAGNGYKGWFQFGPTATWSASARSGSTAPARAAPGREAVSTAGRPGQRLVPAQVSGQVDLAEGVGARPAVAVALNGVIAGVSETFREADARGSQPTGPPDKFSAMALDTLFKKGDNRLELFVIDDSGGQVRLRPLTVS